MKQHERKHEHSDTKVKRIDELTALREFAQWVETNCADGMTRAQLYSALREMRTAEAPRLGKGHDAHPGNRGTAIL
jgi:hypothetical protein